MKQPNKYILLFACCALFTLVSCSSKPPLKSFSDSNVEPDSAKIKTVISISSPEYNEKLSAVLFAVPQKRYRLEISASFGISLASILWSEGEWKAVFPQDNRYSAGSDECVAIPSLGRVNIHKFAALFWLKKSDSFFCDDSSESFDIQYQEKTVSVTRGKENLSLEIKDINQKVKWSPSTWKLVVPESYTFVNSY